VLQCPVCQVVIVVVPSVTSAYPTGFTQHPRDELVAFFDPLNGTAYNGCPRHICRTVLFCSLAILDPRYGHTMDVLSSFLLTLPRESCPRIDLLGLPHLILCRKLVGHLCCKLYCFLFLEFLEFQRRNAVLSLSFSQTFSVTTSNWWSVSQSAPGYVRQFIKLVSILAHLRRSLSDSGCRLRRVPDIQPPWILFERGIG